MSQALSSLPGPNIRHALNDYRHDPLGFMTRCAREFGDIVPLSFGKQQYCLLTNPDHIAIVLKDRLRFIKAEDVRMLRGLLGNGLITSEGDFWQQQRRLIQPTFHHQRIQAYGAVMVDYTQRMLQTWREGDVRDIHDEMMRLTLDIVMKTIFDQEMTDSEASQIAHALDAAMSWYIDQDEDRSFAKAGWRLAQTLFNRSMTPVFRVLQHWGYEEIMVHSRTYEKYQSAIALLDNTIYAIISRRRKGGQGHDLLGMLMQVQDADDGTQMTDQQLRDEVATLMLAGHETTANALSWAALLLAKHPQIQVKLAAELTAVLNGRIPSVADLPQLTYADSVIKEAMRLFPPITDLSREATEDCEIGGYFIPKGTTLIASQWVMHRDPRFFTDPELFQPERWTDNLGKRLPRGVYFPFGDGPRVCIGQSFAQMEAVLVLATLAQKFQFSFVPDQIIELQPSITLRPKHGVKVLLKKA